MFLPSFQIQKPLGEAHNVDPQDVLATKKALNRLGYYQLPEHGLHPYPDQSLFDSVKAFQKDEGLRVDGFMRPRGPTEAALDNRLAEVKRKDANTPVPMPDQPGVNSKRCDAIGTGKTRIDDYSAVDANHQLYYCKEEIPGMPRWEAAPGRFVYPPNKR
ncbi:MAG: peptidoglycan-binding protein [Alphaproteobacteria bacterium]|nr:peptidoglycan-binding protein [Alphaproteobacteria bacterium]